MARKLPTARLERDVAGIKQVWRVDWPSTPFKAGKTYIATTYPDSDLISIETAAKRRPVSATVGRNILPQIRDAIARAREVPA